MYCYVYDDDNKDNDDYFDLGLVAGSLLALVLLLSMMMVLLVSYH